MTLTSSFRLFAKPSRMASGLRAPAGWIRREAEITERDRRRLNWADRGHWSLPRPEADIRLSCDECFIQIEVGGPDH
jgi:hypothetical protein